jgi:hypothetical protein
MHVDDQSKDNGVYEGVRDMIMYMTELELELEFNQ